MATWIAHFRIADYFLNKLDVLETEFIVGNIGPDCGEPNEDRSQFIPSSHITHWSPNGEKNGIDSEAFFNKYLSNISDINKKQFSFYIGYYIHLLTDIEFSKLVAIPKILKYLEEYNKDKNFIWVVKKDWYDIDHLFLRENSDFKIFKIFESIEEFPNIYLDYYSQTAIIKQIKHITKFYQNPKGELDRVYTYLTKEDMNNFVEQAIKNIFCILEEKRLLIEQS